MSQSWHAHWAEDSFEPTRLGNWQVPNWHPKFPCGRHCVTTKFLADGSGRLLPDQPRSKRSPWGGFKGTWELPLKIDRKLARILSAPPRHVQAAWEAHKIRYQGSCGTNVAIARKLEKKAPSKRNDIVKTMGRKIARPEIARTKATGNGGRNLKRTEPRMPEKIVTRQKHIQNGDGGDGKEEEIGVVRERSADKIDREIRDRAGDGPEAARKQPVHSVGQLDREENEEKIKSKCLCTHTSDNRSTSEITSKAIRKNICAVHRRLRV